MLELLLASTRVVFILNWESLLRTCGVTVNETTLGDITEYRNGYTISLIAAKTGEWMFKKYSEKVVEDTINQKSIIARDISGKKESLFDLLQGPFREEEIFEILDSFFAHHSKMPFTLGLSKNQKFGSLLHYFAALGDASVIQKLLWKHIGYPPDLENTAGYTPLLVALHRTHEDIILQLLKYEVDVNKKDPTTKLTPLQLLCEKEFRNSPRCGEIIDKLLQKGIYF
jgi:hypothetical protein